jgi:RHS repeat-associated protein
MALPKGGGAIRGIGETFSTSAVTGTGSTNIPIATSPGRSGFGPALALAYDSGAGNGPFGFGWSLSAPAIRRKTDKGVPRYRDDDVVTLYGADDLVVVQGPPPPAVTWGGRTYARQRLRPRSEGAYARIERWTNVADQADSLWRSVSKDNVTSWYGLDAAARVADPADARRVFEWLLSQVHDDRGNVVVYDYKAEDSVGVDPAPPHERNRTPQGRAAGRYLKRIRYGNRAPYRPELDVATRTPLPQSFMFEVVLDYGEHDPAVPTPVETQPWPLRPDPFSRCRAGFEVRTYRRCRRVLVFHHFPGRPGVGADCLVGSTDLLYADEQSPAAEHPTGFSFLRAVTATGYIRTGAGYTAKSLPPLELTYSAVRVDDRLRTLPPAGVPAGVDGRQVRWADLDGDGAPGVLSEHAGSWYYARNISPGSRTAALAPPVAVAKPSLACFERSQTLADLAADGTLDVVDLAGDLPGFHERTADRAWGEFRAFEARPNVDFSDPGMRLVDLTGDGLPDIMVSADDAIVWYPSLGEAGFGPCERVAQVLDEERGPRVVLTADRESMQLADLSGDGLVDLVRVRSSEICYWPNLGHGRFGPKVTMSDAPRLAAPETFDPRRVLLADVDGSGTADLVHLSSDGVELYFNRSGNSWSAPFPVGTLGAINDPTTVSAVDLLGSGTTCLVVSSPLPSDAEQPLRYVDLMADGKPHLLTGIVNNLGGETRIMYAPSTRFAQSDERAGRPWTTRLPFPVHVVERVESIDHVAGTRYVSRNAYHHGCFDGREREFRGFAMIERHDTDLFDEVADTSGGGQDLSAQHRQPPVTTYTWFHTGTLAADGGLGNPLAHEYHGEAALLGDAVLPAVAAGELAECVRALRGVPLREEVYSFDGSARQDRPYTVTEHRYAVRQLQPRGSARNGVYAVDGLESITQRLEREQADPRVAHSVNLELDAYGHAVRTAAVTYGRVTADPALPAAVRAAQSRRTITYVEVEHTPDIDVEGLRPAYRLRVPYEVRSYEVTGVAPDAGRFAVAELDGKIAAAAQIGYEVLEDGSAQRRLVGHHRTLFRDDALAPQRLGSWDTLALAYESYTLAHTPGTLAAYPAGSVSAGDLTAASFVDLDGDGRFWTPSGRAVFGPAPGDHFFLAAGARDPFGIETRHVFDADDLLVERVTTVQATWNETLAVNDYRVLAPVQKTDPNGNRSAVELDPLGMVSKQVTMGKAGSADGDTLAEPTATLEYDLDAWRLRRTPCFVRVRAREEHGDPDTRWHERVVYSDGHGGVALVKERVAPGRALRVDPDGTTTPVDADPRWRGSGRTVVNNKGRPIRSYDPYFSTSEVYEDQDAVRKIGFSPVQFYDPVGRAVRVEFPEGAVARTVYETWRQQAFDANDTVLESRWYADRGSPDPATEVEPLADPQRRAAWLAAMHADTPGTVHFDAMGRAVYAVSDYGSEKTAAVRMQADYGERFTTVFDQFGRQSSTSFAGLGGQAITSDSAERGRRWTFTDAAGAVVRAWDEHGRTLRAEYDGLRRPLSAFASSRAGPEVLLNHVVYGDRHPQARARNLLNTPHLVFDQAGMVRIDELDFRGNPTRVDRLLALVFEQDVDWAAVAAQADVAAVETTASGMLDVAEVLSVRARVNALGRPTNVTLPDATVLAATYDEGGALAALEVQPGGIGAFEPMLVGQDYDAKGRRLLATYGNGLQTRYAYEALTDRLAAVTTLAPNADPATQALQRLSYTYDPVGNVVAIDDGAQPTRFFQNAVVTAECRLRYDALYQLVAASGREHAGTPNDAILSEVDLDAVGALPAANDATAVRRYTEEYEYDLAGNITRLAHRYRTQAGAGAGWTRRYRYAYEDDPADVTNRLAATSLPGDPEAGPFSATYDHDVYGNMTRLPHLPALQWNALDQLRHVSLGGGGTAHYVYGAGGERVRRVVVRPGGLQIEHISLGAYEIRRERLGAAPPRLEHRVVHVADDRGRIAQIETKTVDTAGAEPDNAIGAPVVVFRYSSHSASVTLLTDAAGVPISYEEYHPWGTSAYRSAKPKANLSLKRYRFAGKHRDEESSLYAFGARYYAPWLGRWTSTDPAGTASGMNLFRYCANNPTGRADADGLQDRPLNPAGQVSWVVPTSVFSRNGQRLADAQATANFEGWMQRTHPDRPFTPGSVTIDWSSMSPGGRRGPTFNAEWLGPNGRPLLPRVGEFGYVAPMNQQPRAEYTDPANRRGRLTENEHGTPHASQSAVEPGYGDREYREDPTTRNPRNVAVDKTRGDNAASRQLQAQAAAGQPIDPTEVDMQANGRFQAANERARTAGQPHIENPGSINRGTLRQMDQRFERGRQQSLPSGAVIEEPHIAPNEDAPSTPTAPVAPAAPPSAPRGSGGFLVGAMNTGGNFALAATRTFVPGVVEAEMAFTGGAMYAYGAGYTAVYGALTTAAAYTPVVGGALVAGAIGGNVGEAAAAHFGAGREGQLAAGVIAAAATGAAVGALIGSVVPIAGTVIGLGAGAAVGAVAGLAGYLISKYW